VGKLEDILPNEFKKTAMAFGNELLLPFVHASAAIRLATEHQIAILGIDAFEVQPDGLATVYLSDPSSHIKFTGDWKSYVTTMNAECDRWLEDHRLGAKYGYILTSASENEFINLTSVS
jgi:hypothetical protein